MRSDNMGLAQYGRCVTLVLSLTLAAMLMGQGCPPSNAPQQPACFEPGEPFNGGVLITMDGSRSSDPDGRTLDYEWIQISGTTVTLSDSQAAVTTFTAPFVNDTLTFQLTVTDLSRLSDTCNATIDVLCPPNVITGQPADQNLCLEETAIFNVAASGLGDLAYRWQKDNVDLNDDGHYVGTTTSTLTISNVNAADVGRYACIVTGPCSTDTSDSAELTLRSTTTITDHPDSLTQCAGTTATFAVTATGEGTLSYQWQKLDVGATDWVNLTNGDGVSGANSASLALSGIADGDAGDYRCVVSGNCGAATSNGASLAVQERTRITNQPNDLAINFGASATFSVTASGTGPFSYQWQFNRENINDGEVYSGTRTRTLTIPNGNGLGGFYRCVVSGACGSDTSDEAFLFVAPG